MKEKDIFLKGLKKLAKNCGKAAYISQADVDNYLVITPSRLNILGKENEIWLKLNKLQNPRSKMQQSEGSKTSTRYSLNEKRARPLSRAS